MECESKSDTGKNRGEWNLSESLRQNFSNIPVKHEIKELQKIVILDTAHILRKVLMSKYRTYFTGEINAAQIVNTEQQ